MFSQPEQCVFANQKNTNRVSQCEKKKRESGRERKRERERGNRIGIRMRFGFRFWFGFRFGNRVLFVAMRNIEAANEKMRLVCVNFLL